MCDTNSCNSNNKCGTAVTTTAVSQQQQLGPGRFSQAEEAGLWHGWVAASLGHSTWHCFACPGPVVFPSRNPQCLRSFWGTRWLMKVLIPALSADQAGQAVSPKNWIHLFSEMSDCSSLKELQVSFPRAVFPLAFIVTASFNGCFSFSFLPYEGQDISLDAVNWKKWKKGRSRGGAPNHLPVTLLRFLTPKKAQCQSVKVQPFPTPPHSLPYKNQS